MNPTHLDKREGPSLIKRIIGRVVLVAGACLAVAYSGYYTSRLRAHSSNHSDSALAAAGATSSPSSLFDNETLPSEDNGYRLSSLSVFSNVALHVKDHYVEPSRVDPKKMLLSALEEVEQQTAEILVESLENDQIRLEVMGKHKVIVNDVESLWEINLKLREVFRFFEKHLPPQDDVRLIEYAAINGALSTLDPHSILLKPEAFAEMKTSTKGEFGGLGIVISVRDEKLTVVSPIDDTPADRAGLKAGDVISRIGDVSTVSMAVDEAVRMLRGPKGSKVVIWVDRTDWAEPRRFSIIRERIKLESVESKLLSSNVGYIKVKSFQQNTGRDLDEHLEKLTTKAKGKMSGLILDLRNNPGGLLEQATRISDRFVSSGDIVTTVGYGNKLREPKRARWSGTETDLPLAVLVNRGSASASEIVAGALKNLDRATVIGETTFGKGSVQVLYDFADNSALKLTIAQYLTPGDISIQNEGVQPDIALRPAWLRKKGVRMFYNSNKHRESSLKQHLERASESQTNTDKPTYAFTYLVQEPEKDDSEPTEEAPDFPVNFAAEYLLSSSSSRRSTSLKKGKKLIQKTVHAQEKAIVERATQLGLNWSPSPSNNLSEPKLKAKLMLVDPQTPGRVTAGSEVTLSASVKNDGDAPIYRVHGILASDNPAFEGREFLFGRILPGETKRWEVQTRVPREESSRFDDVRLELASDSTQLSSETSVNVKTELVPQPQFAFTWVFDDTKRGDGDGILEVGEGVEMSVLVTNIGPGSAEKVALRLRSAAKEDLFLERGRAQIGKIGPGETKEGQLKFRVPKRQSGQPELPLELAVYDSPSGEWLEAKFGLKPQKPQKASVRARKGWVKAKAKTPLVRGTEPNSPVIGVLDKDQYLKTNAQIGRYRRVRLPTGANAFVKSTSVTFLKKKAPKVKLAALSYNPAVRPPHIAFEEAPSKWSHPHEKARIKGLVSGRNLRDIYVLLNNDKVYFERAEELNANKASDMEPIGDWTPPNDNAVVLPFDIKLDLEDGLNKVIVVARVDETVMSHRTLFLSRTEAPKVANRDDMTPASELDK